MRIHKASEAILAKYAPETKIKITPSFGFPKTKAKGSSLEEFYQELSARNTLQIDQVYLNKNANEIESIMIQNRRLIEAKRKPKK